MTLGFMRRAVPASLALSLFSRCFAVVARSKQAFQRPPGIVWVKASEVAACIGRNPYKTPLEVLTNMHKEYGAETFTGQTKMDMGLEAVERLPAAERTMLRQAAALPLTKAVEVQKVLTSVTGKIKENSAISPADKKNAVEFLVGSMNTGFGTRTEDIIVKSVEEKQQIKMQRDPTMYELKLFRLGDTQYGLRGKIDRLQEEGGETILVEVKSRTRKLFKELRDYENIQMQCYLNLLPAHLGVRRARLTENYENQSQSYDIGRDEALWKGHVVPGLLDFCQQLDNAIKGKK